MSNYPLCPKCGKRLTQDEAWSKNWLKGYAGKVCYPCLIADRRSKPYPPDTQLLCPSCNTRVPVAEYNDALERCEMCVEHI